MWTMTIQYKHLVKPDLKLSWLSLLNQEMLSRLLIHRGVVDFPPYRSLCCIPAEECGGFIDHVKSHPNTQSIDLLKPCLVCLRSYGSGYTADSPQVHRLWMDVESIALKQRPFNGCSGVWMGVCCWRRALLGSVQVLSSLKLEQWSKEVPWRHLWRSYLC